MSVRPASRGNGSRLRGADFAALLGSRARRKSRHFLLMLRPSQTPRLGMVVSKRLAGNAVRRNLVKRHARAAFAQWLGRLEHGGLPGYDVLLRVASDVRRLPRQEQSAEILGLFDQVASPTVILEARS